MIFVGMISVGMIFGGIIFVEMNFVGDLSTKNIPSIIFGAENHTNENHTDENHTGFWSMFTKTAPLIT